MAEQIQNETARRIARVAKELQDRKTDALRLFRPMEQQVPFFKSTAQERILRGGNRCLPGWEKLYDPVAKKWRRLDKTTKPFYVWSYDAASGRKVIAKSSAPFVKGHEEFYKITLSNGQSFSATANHLLLTADGYKSVAWCVENRKSALFLRSTTLGTSPLASRKCARRLTETGQGCLENCSSCLHQCDAQPQTFQETFRASSPSQVDVDRRSHERSRLGASSLSRRYSHLCLSSFRLSNSGYRFQSCESPCESQFRAGRLVSEQSNQSSRAFLLSSSRTASLRHKVRAHLPLIARPFAEAQDRESVFRVPSTVEICSPENTQVDLQFPMLSTDRRCTIVSTRSLQSCSHGTFCGVNKSEWLIIDNVSEIGKFDVWDIHVHGTNNYELAGVFHHNSGKTMCAAAEFASAVTGIPLCDEFGNDLPFKFPRHIPMNTWIIGYDQNHIGKTMYRYLFMPGAFYIIQDEKTGEWRAYNPIADEHRKDQRKPSPPLIPQRYVEQSGWAWEDKANRVFSVCRLKNGTEIRAFSSKGHAAMGDGTHLIWLDEDVEHPEHVREWEMRLPSVEGKLIWSAFPLSKNDALRDLHERAEREKHSTKPVVQEFVIKFQDNAYISEEQIQARKDGMSEEEWKARNDGEFSTESVLMFPSFHIDTHGVPQRDERFDDEVDRLLRKSNGVPPSDWTRYLIVDPGHTLAAVMFAAVAPPDKFGELYYIYDELYLRLKSAEDMAKAVRLKTTDVGYEAFIMDFRAGRQTPMGYSTTIMENYAKAFAAEGVKSRLTGSSFIWGSDDIEHGNECVRSWLRIQANGKPKLRIARSLEAMKFEFARYRKQVVGNLVKEKQVDRDNHLMSCLRYFSAYQPTWHPPIVERIPSRMERLMGTLDAMFGKSSNPSGPIRMGAGASS